MTEPVPSSADMQQVFDYMKNEFFDLSAIRKIEMYVSTLEKEHHELRKLTEYLAGARMPSGCLQSINDVLSSLTLKP